MSFLSWLIFGLFAGIIAKMITPGKNDPKGCIMTIIIGIVGAFIGGLIGKQLGFGTVTGFNLKSFAIAVIGSVIFLVLFSLLSRRR